MSGLDWHDWIALAGAAVGIGGVVAVVAGAVLHGCGVV